VGQDGGPFDIGVGCPSAMFSRIDAVNTTVSSKTIETARRSSPRGSRSTGTPSMSTRPPHGS
jgi:hypothetical protein